MKHVTFDRDKRDRLRLAYTAHLDRMANDASVPDVFEFEGSQFVIGYAKYLLEYLDLKMGS